MKLDVKVFRYLTPEDWRVLTAFEMGSKNHEVVPTALATQISGLHNGSGGVGKSISTLAKENLVSKVKNAKYDGYRFTFGGYDYLALHAHVKSSAIVQLGSTMGVGKESDILLVTSPSPLSGAPIQSILKIHRLGRTSFRTASTKRSYKAKREHASWQLLSRLSAQKEFQAMNILRDAGFRTPRPIAWNRHTIVMSLVPGMPLRQVPLFAFGRSKEEQKRGVGALYAELIELVLKLAEYGLIHGDMNEFNVLIEGVPEDLGEEEGKPGQQDSEFAADSRKSASAPGIDAMSEADAGADAEAESQLIPHLIDFPQITSMSHPEAKEFFERDIRGIKEFFRKRYRFDSSDSGPHFTDAVDRLRQAASRGERKLDIEIEAAGYSKKASRDLDDYYNGREQASNGEEIDEGSKEEADTNAVDDEVDLTSPAQGPDPTPEGIGIEAPHAHSAFQDLMLGLEEMKLSAQGASEKPRPKSKVAAGWSI